MGMPVRRSQKVGLSGPGAAYSTTPSRAPKGRACTIRVVLGRPIGARLLLARQRRVGGVPGHRLEPDIEVELALFDGRVRQDRFHLDRSSFPPAVAGAGRYRKH
jgi:hypothetical protein